jgi:hypothetical protein
MTTDERRADTPDDRYKWVALINTTLGVLVVTINSSILAGHPRAIHVRVMASRATRVPPGARVRRA